MNDQSIVALTDELAELSKQQSEALQQWAYLNMSASEGLAYDSRGDRMRQICGMLATWPERIH
jgi:hypothetical protein